MTLHITQVSARYILQLSDRLISGGIQDPIANKNIIYWSRDAIVTIGYAGVAYGLSRSNPDLPTDEWIVEKLRGIPIPRIEEDGRPWASSGGLIPRWHDIGESLEILRKELQDVFKKSFSFRRHSFSLTIAGWQGFRCRVKGKGIRAIYRRVRPVIADLTKREGQTNVVLDRVGRYWYLPNQWTVIDSPHGYLLSAERSELRRRLRRGIPDESESVMAKTVVAVASRCPAQVGPHCISILLPPPGAAPIRVRFIPDMPHLVVVTKAGVEKEYPVTFSPWIVGPFSLWAPSVMKGRCSMQMGPFLINIESPSPDADSFYFLRSMQRPPGP